VNETVSEQALRELFRLTHPALVKRNVRALQNARCIAISLAMAYDQNRYVA
jgi:hypothetical protein